MTLLIEPEGQAVTVCPGQDCVIRAIGTPSERHARFELKLTSKLLSVSLLAQKVVVVDGVEVHRDQPDLPEL